MASARPTAIDHEQRTPVPNGCRTLRSVGANASPHRRGRLGRASRGRRGFRRPCLCWRASGPNRHPGPGREAPGTRFRRKRHSRRNIAFRRLTPQVRRARRSSPPPTSDPTASLEASDSPLFLSAADATTPSGTAAPALAQATQSDAAPVPIPPSSAAAPAQSNGVREPDPAQPERAILAPDDFHLDSLSDASFVHPVLSPDPVRLPGKASVSLSAAKSDAESHSAPLRALRNGVPKAASSKQLILGTADFGHAFTSHASFVQSVFLLDLTVLPSGTTAKAIELARAAHVAPLADAFRSRG